MVTINEHIRILASSTTSEYSKYNLEQWSKFVQTLFQLFHIYLEIYFHPGLKGTEFLVSHWSKTHDDINERVV